MDAPTPGGFAGSAPTPGAGYGMDHATPGGRYAPTPGGAASAPTPGGYPETPGAYSAETPADDGPGYD